MMHKSAFLTLSLLGCAAVHAAAISTTISVTAVGAESSTSFGATGTATLTNIGSGSFTTTIPLTSLTSATVTAPITIGLSAVDTLTGTVTMPVTLLLGALLGTATSGSGSIAITGGTGSYLGATGSFPTVTGQGSLSGTSINLTFAGNGTINTSGTTTSTTPNITAVLDAASNTANVAPGGIFIVKGTNLSASGTTSFGPPRPTTSPSSVSITFTPAAGGTGTNAYLVYLYNASGVNQLAGILPSTVTPGSYNVTVTNGTSTSANFATTVVANKLGLFTQDSSGTGLASVQNYISPAVVDLNRLTTGSVSGTTISPAKPGQPVIAYGTGLGAYTAGDNALSPVYDYRSTLTIKAIVGGVTIPTDYAGLAGYAGEDQINFTLPSTISTGCAVPLQISVNGTLSPITYISIAPDSSSTACVAPGFTSAQLQNLDQGGTFTAGGFSLVNLTETVPSVGTEVFGTAGGSFTRFTAYQMASASQSLNAYTSGACTIYQSSSTTTTTTSAPSGTTLDAGALTLTGPSGSSLSNAALTDTNNLYSLTITSLAGLGVSGYVNGSLVAGVYTLSGAGGKDVGKFTASVTIGTPLTVTGGLPSSITRSAGMTLNWTGGNTTDVVEIIGSSSATTGGAAMAFSCTTTAGQKTFTVPSSILSQLPASTAGFLEVASFPAAGTFSAPLTAGGSIDAGIFTGLSGAGNTPIYQ